MAEPMVWKICVSGYGSFEFEGTEAEAEAMRVHKARWEQGIACKHGVNETCLICKGKAEEDEHA